MKVLAVSGGIDSMVMLHMLRDDPDVIVAHFDHGIRLNSHEDCDFVERVAREYGKKFICKRVKLGANCSEQAARNQRYQFLRDVAERYKGDIYVAHHADDVLETIAINVYRGTGWRGLAPMRAAGVVRPLINMSKADICRYAGEHQLHFREDPTNNSDDYLRNRIRNLMHNWPKDDKKRLFQLYLRQVELAQEIDEMLEKLMPRASHYDRAVADEIELLRYILESHEVRLTRPQLVRCKQAIKELGAGKRYSLDAKHFIKMNQYSFTIE